MGIALDARRRGSKKGSAPSNSATLGMIAQPSSRLTSPEKVNVWPNHVSTINPTVKTDTKRILSAGERLVRGLPLLTPVRK